MLISYEIRTLEIMSMQLYPIKFIPVLKPTIWGGDIIAAFKGIDTGRNDIGESWEISAVEGSESIVVNGCYNGMNLPELVHRFGSELLGPKVFSRFGTRFPLLIKFIDAHHDLSVQVHPDEHLARQRHNTSGKNEMWYVLSCEPHARIYAGFAKQLTPAEFRRLVAENDLLPSLGCYEPQSGDVYYLAAGTIHAIGAGNFIVEIQESSDITYRISDYGRLGADGKPRELHVEQAIDALDFRPDQVIRQNVPADRDAELVSCPQFKVGRLNITGRRDIVTTGESFTTIVCINGSGIITTTDGHELPISQGESVLIPAALTRFTITGDIILITSSL